VLAAKDGAIVVWRGALDGKVDRWAIAVSERGDVRGAPAPIGSAFCATADGLAWLDRAQQSAAPVRARFRLFGEDAAREAAQFPAEPTPTLVCAEHVVYAIVEDDDRMTVTQLANGDAGAPVALTSSADFPESDAEDDQRIFTSGDDLGVVRVAESGALAVREITRGALGAWKPLKSKLSTSDDVLVAADADASSIVLVYTRDRSETCKDAAATAKSVHALRIDRATGDERRVDLAVADCNKPVGPFFLEMDRAIVAWVERAKMTKSSPPIAALSFRSLAAGGAPGRIEQAADAIADAGCDGAACYAVALVRAPGSDGMSPEALRLVRYP
jgi:hypothetical protein